MTAKELLEKTIALQRECNEKRTWHMAAQSVGICLYI